MTDELINQTFGRWTVLYRVPNILTKKGRRYPGPAKYHCRCACGNERDVYASNLISGNSKSCGCFKKDTITNKNETAHETHLQQMNAVVGRKIDKLFVDSYDEYSDKFQCTCDCGTACEMTPFRLLESTAEVVKSCGCAHKVQTKNIIGEKYGLLTVINRDEDGMYPNGRRYARWICKCQCGDTVVASTYNLSSGTTRCCSTSKHMLKGSSLNEVLIDDMPLDEYIRLQYNMLVSNVSNPGKFTTENSCRRYVLNNWKNMWDCIDKQYHDKYVSMICYSMKRVIANATICVDMAMLQKFIQTIVKDFIDVAIANMLNYINSEED